MSSGPFKQDFDVLLLGGDLGRAWFSMETVVHLFVPRNYQKVKNEAQVVKTITKGMAKAIYNSTWADTEMKIVHLKQECFNSIILTDGSASGQEGSLNVKISLREKL